MNTVQRERREPSPTSVTARLKTKSFKVESSNPPLKRMEEFYSEDSGMEMEMEMEVEQDEDEEFENEIFNIIRQINRDEEKNQLVWNIWNVASEACGSHSLGWRFGKDPLSQVSTIITPERLQTIDDPLIKKNLLMISDIIAHAYDRVHLLGVEDEDARDWNLPALHRIPEWAYDVNI